MADFLLIAIVLIILIIIGAIMASINYKSKNKVYYIGSRLSILSIILIPCIYHLCFRDINFKQDVNVNPIIQLNLPQTIQSINDMYNDTKLFKSSEIVVSDGINKNTGSKQPGDIKEMASGSYINGSCWVETKLFYSVEDAQKNYDFYKKSYLEDRKILKSEKNNDYSYCISYVEQNRADPEGLSVLRDTYSSYVIIRKNNLLIILCNLNQHDISSNYNDFIADFGEYLTEKYPQW